jgi:hypothetical protein
MGSYGLREVLDHLSLLRLASSPEYRLCGRSLRTAMPSAFFCPIMTSLPATATVSKLPDRMASK